MLETLSLLAAAIALATLLPGRARAWLSSEAGLALAVGAAALALALALACCAYAHPCMDDYQAASMVRDRGWWTSLQEYRHGWGGRYTSAALCLGLVGRLEPSRYHLLCAGHLLALVGSALWCARAIPILAGRAAAAALLALATWLSSVDHPSETLFWFSGWCSYQLGIILDLLALGALMRARGPLGAAAAAGLAALAAGCAETAALPLAAAIALHAWRCWRDPSGRMACLAAGAAFLAGFAISALAPGNAARYAEFINRPEGAVLARRLALTAWAPFMLALDALARAPVAAAALAAAAWGWARADALQGARAWTVLVASWAGIAAAHAPAQVALGALPLRAQNVELFAVVVGLLAAAALAGAAARSAAAGRELDRLRPYALAWLALGASLAALIGAWRAAQLTLDTRAAVVDLAACGLIAVARPWRRREAWDCWPSLRAGLALMAVACLGRSSLPALACDLVRLAPSWSRQLAQRDAFCARSAARLLPEVLLPPIPGAEVPQSFSAAELGWQADDWYNRCYARWYGVRAVRLVVGLAWSADGTQPIDARGQPANPPASGAAAP